MSRHGVAMLLLLAMKISLASETPPPLVDELEISGLHRVDAKEVLAIIRTHQGQPFDRATWSDDFHRLYDSGYS